MLGGLVITLAALSALWLSDARAETRVAEARVAAPVVVPEFKLSTWRRGLVLTKLEVEALRARRVRAFDRVKLSLLAGLVVLAPGARGSDGPLVGCGSRGCA